MENTQRTRILIGDDQFGEGSPQRAMFEISYEDVLSGYDVDFTVDPAEYVKLAQTGNYSALMIDLRWGSYLPTHGYDILSVVRHSAPVRILWTSESDEARTKGYQFGATACLEKNPTPSKLERALKGERVD